MGDVALVPQRDILQRRGDVAAHHAREAGQVLGQHRVALVRHRRRALLARARNIPRPPALRCAADGGFRSRAARSTTAITPSVAKNIAWRSRGITWVETGSTVRPSFSATCASTRGSILAKVPTAPEIAQVAISARAATSRARLRANSACACASFSPKVTGSAWMPWLRPIVGVSLCSIARRLSTASNASRSASSRSAASRQLHGEAGVEHVATTSSPDA